MCTRQLLELQEFCEPVVKYVGSLKLPTVAPGHLGNQLWTNDTSTCYQLELLFPGDLLVAHFTCTLPSGWGAESAGATLCCQLWRRVGRQITLLERKPSSNHKREKHKCDCHSWSCNENLGSVIPRSLSGSARWDSSKAGAGKP